MSRASLIKQKGATLFTALVFLILMTIVGVSAAKVSMLDVLMAGNNEQQMQLYQSTSNQMKSLATITELFEPLAKENGKEFDSNNTYTLPNRPNFELTIIDTQKSYLCGDAQNKAVSVGGSSKRNCNLYNFEVRSKAANTGIRDRIVRGAGKELPKPGSVYSGLN